MLNGIVLVCISQSSFVECTNNAGVVSLNCHMEVVEFESDNQKYHELQGD